MNWKVLGGVAAAIVSVSAPTWAQDVTEVRFGSSQPIKIVAPKGLSANSYASILFDSYTNILASNAPLNRYIRPADVVVLCPPASTSVIGGKRPVTSTTAGKSGKTSTPIPVEAKLPPTGTYIIYVMGRRFVTVTPEMAKANGVPSSGVFAARLARRYMQTFPRECFRPPSLPALTNIPASPPLRLTTNLEQCIPADVTGKVYMLGKALFNTANVQPDGSTGPDKAALLTKKTTKIITNRDPGTPGTVTAVKNAAAADVKVDGQTLYTLSVFDAKSNGLPNPLAFAQYLSKQITARLASGAPAPAPSEGEPAPVPAPTPETPTTPDPTPPTTPEPAPPTTPEPAPPTTPEPAPPTAPAPPAA
ncbi:MAG: hypothetical protein H8F28_10915 [Fibrella sp.]|nr:hypothetical protein [Armatimonadota bacterium]